ncbi:MAG: DUF5127 domain-containing protein [Verrucomicrobiota bacterium]
MNTRPLLLLAAALLGPLPVSAQPFRPPSVPLVTFDPFLSIWSPADHLNDRPTQHWTRREHSLVSLLRVDGRVFRLMGAEPDDAPALPQVALKVTPTRTICDFENTNIHVTLTFLTPALPNDLDAFSLPLSFLAWQVRSVDGKKHAVSIYDSASSQIAVNRTDEKVAWSREKAGPLTALRVGTLAQPVLGSSGDNHRINWGYAYLAASAAQSSAAFGADQTLVAAFLANGHLPSRDDTNQPRAANDDQPVMAFVFDLGQVSSAPVQRQAILAYDEIYAIKYFGQKLRPYWRRNGASASDMLRHAAADYPKLAQRCAAFDAQLMADAAKAGGPKYAQMCALAYRQCAAACGLAADSRKQPLYFTKENTSNGDIATVDVFFPMDPQWLLLSPVLAKATLVPILAYAASPRWKFPNAPHDLGTYPIVTGRDDGGEGMPVEESGNMLILCDAVAHADGNANFVSPWWPQLTQWAKYLQHYGLDPENQLCTDDFMGHLAHNANLSIKAILGLASYADLCRLRGDAANAAKYRQLALADAAHWVTVAADGDHYRLAFDMPNTWSQKYNLVWDRILSLNIFPPEVAQKEVAHSKTVMQRYGVPLDSRTKLTKTDWSFWNATLADNQADFQTLTSPIYDYLNQTSARSPFVDSYTTTNSRSDGMHARPVIGGIFIKMLADPQLWHKWAGAAKIKASDWAPLPVPPQYVEIVPTSQKTPALWRYTTQTPSADWAKPEFDASAWNEGPGSFGTPRTPGAFVHTLWNTPDIWLRRQITLPAVNCNNLCLCLHHDDDAEVYINGVLAASETGFLTAYELLDITPQALALLKPGATVLLAVHCHQYTGGQNIDVGLVSLLPPPSR